jgi:alpha-D-ribose 1-methylphosphonate 5-triphosphate synthase subunit PhnH
MSLQPLPHLPVRPGLKPGLADPVFDAQSVFRAVLSANAYPGRIIFLDSSIDAPYPLASSTAFMCLTLMDIETPVWLDPTAATGEVPRWLRFHCGAPLRENASSARFVVLTDTNNLPRLDQFHPGDMHYPDRSATVIIQVPSLTEGPETVWTGPGIRERASVRIAGLPAWFWSDRDLNTEHYPLGVDVFFTCGNALLALPRTIKVEV